MSGFALLGWAFALVLIAFFSTWLGSIGDMVGGKPLVSMIVASDPQLTFWVDGRQSLLMKAFE